MMKILLSVVAAISVTAADCVSARWDRNLVAQAQTRPAPSRPAPPPAEPEPRRSERPPESTRQPQGKLNDEQRRELHRDLDRANREIYKNQGRR